MKSPSSLILVLCTITIMAALAQETLVPLPHAAKPEKPDPVRYDAEGHVVGYDAKIDVDNREGEKVGSPRRVQRKPLFVNAPFLRLRKGDQFVIGRRWSIGGKFLKPGFESDNSYFLKSRGKYFHIWSYDRPEGRKLGDATEALQFVWDVNLKNATKLAYLYKGRNANQFTVAKYHALRAALRKDFPQSLRNDDSLSIRPAAWDARKKCAIFEGLAFEHIAGVVYKYHLTIGADVFRETSRILIVGPPRVERWEFEGPSGGNGVNMMVYRKPDDKTLARLRANYAKMLAFRRVVAQFLPRRERVALLSLRE